MKLWPDSALDNLTAVVAADRNRILDWRDKVTIPSWYGSTASAVAQESYGLDALSTPVMTLDGVILEANIEGMQSWLSARGLKHAPHGKTTMAPEIWLQQLRAGSWGITVANEPQLRLALAVGVPRILLANLLIRPAGVTWLAATLAELPDTDFYCWIDSLSAADQMCDALESTGATCQIKVLLEVGHPAGRTGVRTVTQAHEVANRVRASDGLRLVGVAGFEGVVTHGTDEESLAAVDGFLHQLVAVHRSLGEAYEVSNPILSAGGSAYFDRVAQILGPEQDDQPGTVPGTMVVLRSGAYVANDDGFYRETTLARGDNGPTLRSAMHVWARVISLPEPGVAFLDAGRRDVPFDLSLPEPQLLRRLDESGTVHSFELNNHSVIGLNDQHAEMSLPPDSPIRVGDVVRFGLAHPCTAFDKWSLIPVLDDAAGMSPVVTGFVRTYF